MLRPLRLLACGSAAALILGATPGLDFALVAPAHAQADVLYTASVAPPVLPVYSQPPIPGPGYIWIPGHWAWGGTEYFWVPGFWELPPAADLLWTPGYWGWNDVDNDYAYYSGYWAPTVGFYGGIDYGFGYPGEGYYGGYWRNRHFYYNRAVNNFGTTHIATVFNRPVPGHVTPTGVSFNGGRGGATARPTAAQLAILRGPHQAPTAAQIQHREAASRIASLKYGANHGHPPIAAVRRANEFNGAHIGATAGAVGGAALASHAAGLNREATRAAPNFAARGASHATATERNFAARGPAMHHQNFAARGPHFGGAAGMHFGGAPGVGGTHFGGAPHFAGAGGTHFGNAVGMHFGGAPHFAGGGMHFGGGGAHFGGAPHFGGGGGGMHFGGGGAHFGGGGHRP